MSYVADLFDALDDEDDDRRGRRAPKVKQPVPAMFAPDQMELRADLRARYGPKRCRPNPD